MVLEHDLLDPACRVATLDVVSAGRIRFGIGVGWLPEELSNHRPDVPYKLRYAAAVERVRALRTIWTEDEAEFAGQWDRFQRSWVFPKPIQRPLPIGFGSSGELGMRYAAQLADEWYPIDAVLEEEVGGVGPGIARFRHLLEEAGRDAMSVPITLFVWGWEPGQPSIERIAGYEEFGIERGRDRSAVHGAPLGVRHASTARRVRLGRHQTLTTSSRSPRRRR